MERKGRLIVFCPVIIAIALFTISYAQPERGKIYFVGVGPMGPDPCTLQAIKVMRKADVIYGNMRARKLFKRFFKTKEVRSDRLGRVFHPGGKS